MTTRRTPVPNASPALAAGSIVAEQISKAFLQNEDTVVALEDCTFSIGPGEFVSFVGPSGCGKSTLLRIMDGLEQPSTGRVVVNGVENPAPGPDRGFVFQADSLYPWRTVEANVAFGLEIAGVPKASARQRARAYLGLVGLAPFAKRYPNELSGGMRQRANLARALAVEPRILLMDEPFGALDAMTREIMQAELLRIWNGERTVIFVTHQIEEAVYLSDRVILMSSRPGKIRADLPVPLPRPRTLDVRRTPEFVRISNEIWEHLRDEVLSALKSPLPG